MIHKIYYNMRPIFPRWLQIMLRRRYVNNKRNIYKNIWPIDKIASTPPDDWKGWPNNKKFALILTHDVEQKKGQQKCWSLMEIEHELGFRSCFYFVPERYNVSVELRNHLYRLGFEVGVHGLKHDGKLYKSRKIFQQRAIKINEYIKTWGAVGFRSPAMHHNLAWMHDLNIEYDASTFDTDPFEPQPDGVRTIFPFWVTKNEKFQGYVELPYTLTQDHNLFIIMRENNINIWKEKLGWIVKKGGMVLLNTHPDYMYFQNGKMKLEEYPVDFYKQLLLYIKENYDGQFWHALPREVAAFWKNEVMGLKNIMAKS